MLKNGRFTNLYRNRVINCPQNYCYRGGYITVEFKIISFCFAVLNPPLLDLRVNDINPYIYLQWVIIFGLSGRITSGFRMVVWNGRFYKIYVWWYEENALLNLNQRLTFQFRACNSRILIITISFRFFLDWFVFFFGGLSFCRIKKKLRSFRDVSRWIPANFNNAAMWPN